jgi:hypothetical protein
MKKVRSCCSCDIFDNPHKSNYMFRARAVGVASPCGSIKMMRLLAATAPAPQHCSLLYRAVVLGQLKLADHYLLRSKTAKFRFQNR